jgi:hypothetical protein
MATVVVIPKVLNHLHMISFGYKTGKETDIFRTERNARFQPLATSRSASIISSSVL